MKRLLSFAAAGLMCGAAILGPSGIAGAASTHSGTTAQPGGPMVRTSGASGLPTVAENWSGYAATSTTSFTYVHSTFVQPTIHCTSGKPDLWTSNWVGLDGFDNQTVEQDGTFSHCGGAKNTTPIYQAWYEMYPKGSVNVFKVSPGDIIDASVSYTNSQFVLTISDLTTGQSGSTTAACTSCARASAEWIIERPATCTSPTSCSITALANFRKTSMAAATATVTGGTEKAAATFNPYQIFMIQPIKQGFISLDSAGALTSSTFSVTWERTGAPVPITLGRNH
jgi:Peptidase A4 family